MPRQAQSSILARQGQATQRLVEGTNQYQGITLKPLAAFLFFAILTSSTSAIEPGVKITENIHALAALLSDGKAVLSAEIPQIKNATLAAGGSSINVSVVLFNLEGWQGGRGKAQYLAVFAENPRSDLSANNFSLKSFLKVGEDGQRWFETFSVFGEYIILKTAISSQGTALLKPADVVIRFDPDSIIEVKSLH